MVFFFQICLISIDIKIIRIKNNFDKEIDKFNTASLTIKITGKGKHILLVINSCCNRAMHGLVGRNS